MEFQKFQYLFIPSDIKILKKTDRELEKEAKEWFIENYNACFGSISQCDTKDIITWHYSCGMLMFGVPPLGDYHYKFIIKMIIFEKWKLKEWQEGFLFGREVEEGKHKDVYRDGNPYPEHDFYRYSAWDTGYIMGLHNYSFEQKLK